MLFNNSFKKPDQNSRVLGGSHVVSGTCGLLTVLEMPLHRDSWAGSEHWQRARAGRRNFTASVAASLVPDLQKAPGLHSATMLVINHVRK